MTYEQMVQKHYDQYVEWGYDLFDCVREYGMVDFSLADDFEGGEDGKEACLCALWHLEIDLRNKQEAAV